jgi:hypothetical protein
MREEIERVMTMTKYKCWVAGWEESAKEIEVEDGDVPAVEFVKSMPNQPGMAFLICSVPCDKPAQTSDVFVSVGEDRLLSTEATEGHWEFWNEVVLPQFKAATGGDK